MKNKEYNYYIDFLKFIFSLIIVIYHSWIFTGTFGAGYFNYGFLAVGFYFITTGYLMMNSINKKKKYKDLGIDTLNFLKNKIIKILPYIILAFIIGGFFTYKRNFLNIATLFSDTVVGEFLQIGSTGYSFSINTASWYISSMMIALLVLYPLARKYKNTYSYIIAPIILISLLILVKTYNINTNDPLLISFICQNGLYKAFIFIILGNFAYLITEKIKELKKNKLINIFLTIGESVIYILLIWTFHFNSFGNLVVALLTLFGVAITFSNRSYTSKIFNNKIFATLGKFGFIMYLNNTYVRTAIQIAYPTWRFRKKFIWYIAIVLVISLISYLIIEIIFKWIKEKIKIISK